LWAPRGNEFDAAVKVEAKKKTRKIGVGPSFKHPVRTLPQALQYPAIQYYFNLFPFFNEKAKICDLIGKDRYDAKLENLTRLMALPSWTENERTEVIIHIN